MRNPQPCKDANLFFLKVSICLFERQGDREEEMERERAYIHRITPQIPRVTMAGPGQSRDPESPFESSA